MKRIIKTFVLALTLMLSASNIQAQKIGHINLQDLIKEMPETKKVQDSLAAIQKQWEIILKDGQTELEAIYAALQKGNPNWTPMQRQFKEKEFEEKRQKLEATSQSAQQELQEREQSMVEPIYEKAKKIINEVAKELGYTTVINSNGGYLLLVSNPADDLMAPVKKKMGIVDKPMMNTKPSPVTPK